MESLYTLNVSSDVTRVSSDAIANVQNDLLAARLLAAVHTNVAMNDKEMKIAQSLFTRRLVIASSPLVHVSHPVLHFLNDYATERCSMLMARENALGYPTLEIGGTVKSTANHVCRFITENRDAARFAFQEVEQDLKNYVQTKSPMMAMRTCVRGAQQCHFPARTAYAVNATYEMTMDDVVRVFDNHELEQMFVWMYLPNMLYDDDYHPLDNLSGYYTVARRDRETLFYYGDGNTVYVHPTDLWKKWAHTTLIETPKYNLVLESIERVGIFHQIKIDRVGKFNHLPLRPVLSEQILSYMLIPNLVYYALRGCEDVIDDLPKFIVPCKIYDRAIAYACRQVDSNGYSYTQFATNCDTYREKVHISDKVFWEGWEVPSEQYHAIVQSLYVLGAIARTTRTIVIGTVFKQIGIHLSAGGIKKLWLRLCNWASRNTKPEFLRTVRLDDELGDAEWNDTSLMNIDMAEAIKPRIVGIKHVSFVRTTLPPPWAPLVAPVAPLYMPPQSQPPQAQHVPITPSSFDDVATIPRWMNTGVVPNHIAKRPRQPQHDVSDGSTISDTITRHGSTSTITSCGTTTTGSTTSLRNRPQLKPPTTPTSGSTDGSLASGHTNSTYSSKGSVNTKTDTDATDETADTCCRRKTITSSLADLTAVDGIDRWSVPKVFSHSSFHIDCPTLYRPADVPYPIFVTDDANTLRDHLGRVPDANWVLVYKKGTNVSRKLRSRFLENDDTVYSFCPYDYDLHVRITVEPGWCFIESFTAAASQIRPGLDFNSVWRGLLMGCYEIAHVPSVLENTRMTRPVFLRQMYDYFCHARWDSHFGDCLPMLAAMIYRVQLRVHQILGKQQIVHRFGDTACPPISVELKHDHYVPRLRGGAKRTELKWKNIFDRIEIKDKTFLDLSAAPGFASLEAHKRGAAVTSRVYDGHSALAPFVLDTNNLQYVKYQDFVEVAREGVSYDVVFIDCAAEFASESIIDSALAYLPELLKEGGILIVKQFVQTYCTLQLKERFTDYERIDRQEYMPDGNEAGIIEHFLILKHYDGDPIYVAKDVGVEILKTDVLDYLNSGDIPIAVDVRTKYADTVKNGPERINLQYRMLTGIAGCGKTKNYYAKFCQHMTIVCPTDTLAKEQKRGVTEHKYIMRMDGKPVCVDEAQSFHLGFFYFIPNGSILMGDGDQINHIRCKTNIFEKAGVTTLNRFSYRIPQDIVPIVEKLIKLPIVSRSRVVKSITKEADGDAQQIAFNQDSAKDAKGITVHGAMGSTFSRVTVIADARAANTKLLDNYKYLYVAATRHNMQICFKGPEENTAKFFIEGSGFETLRSKGAKLPVSDNYATRAACDTTTDERDVQIEKFGVSPDDIADIISNTVKTANNVTSMVVAVHLDLKEPKSPIATNAEALTARDVVVRGKTITNRNRNLIVHLSNDPRSALKAGIERYTAAPTPSRMPSGIKVAQGKAETMYERLAKFLYKDDAAKYSVNVGYTPKYSATKKLDGLLASIQSTMTPDYLMRCTSDYLEALNKKLPKIKGKTTSSLEDWRSELDADLITKRNRTGQLITAESYLEVTEPLEFWRESIEYFAKKQTKFKAADAWDTLDKANQGVSAWSKRLNIMFSAITRAAIEKISDELNCSRNDGNRTIIASGTADKDFSAKIADLESEDKRDRYKRYRHFMNDYTEWDASYSNMMVYFEALIFGKCGFNEQLIAEHVYLSSHGKLKYRAKNPMYKFTIYLKTCQHSGKPFTFGGNTLGNMALTCTLFDFEHVLYSIWKGDDSNVKCVDAKESALYQTFMEDGHKLKVQWDEVGEFAGFVITEKGLFPDVIRRAAKYLYKVYDSEEHLNEAKMSVAQDMACILDQSALQYGYHALAHHYRPNDKRVKGLTPHEVMILTSFCDRANSIKYENLVDYNMSVKADLV
jgi:hypothetical protein